MLGQTKCTIKINLISLNVAIKTFKVTQLEFRAQSIFLSDSADLGTPFHSETIFEDLLISFLLLFTIQLQKHSLSAQ